MGELLQSADEDVCHPFEWLTSPSSLDAYIELALGGSHASDEGQSAENVTPRRQGKRVLHVGSGSSLLGERLLENTSFGVEHVVNVDCDDETLSRMEKRWLQEHGAGDELRDRLDFAMVDMSKDAIPGYPNGSFDLIVDKSTLDCTLCSDRATAGLLTEVHRLLAPDGVYMIVSFHHIDLLRPLLEQCPGVDWKVEHHVAEREVEDLISAKPSVNGTTRNGRHQPQAQKTNNGASDTSIRPSSWSADGSFQPDDRYRRTVNVLLCRYKGTWPFALLDPEQVNRHLHAVNDQRYQSQNPMLTRRRRNDLELSFSKRDLVDVHECYAFLFTDAEREHLTYELFLEDWDAFLSSRDDLPRDNMSFETAVAFLQEMQ